MNEFLNWLFSAAALWAWLLLGAAVLVCVYVLRHSSFLLTDLGYTVPFVGKLARYSRDYSVSSYPGWLNVENTLCRDYAKHMSALSKEQFENHAAYLKKAYDHGRRPIPTVAVVLLGTLVILEGLGFSYLLGALMAAEGSENVRELLMVAVVVVLAAILVWATHEAGHQLFRTGLLRNCFREFQTHKDEAFTSRIIGLDEAQSLDDDQPAHVQCANRVVSKPGDIGGYSWVWIAGFLIFAIAVGSTELRIQMLHATQAEDARGAPAAMFATDSPSPPPAAPPTDDPAATAREYAAMTGFTMLAVIFVITQIVGVSIGYRYGFAGKQSKEARDATRGAADYLSYFALIQHRMNIANTRLHALHRMLEKHSPRPLEFTHNFFDFIRDEERRGARDLHLPPGPQKLLTARAASASSATQEEAPAAAAAETDPLDQAFARWTDAATEEAQNAYFRTLPRDLRAALKTRILDRNAAAQTEASRHPDSLEEQQIEKDLEEMRA